MIILNNPYVSDFLIETIKDNDYLVLDTKVARKYFALAELTSSNKASYNYKFNKEIFYSNSEDSIDWVDFHLKNTMLNSFIKTCKDKLKFRKKLEGIYPNYKYKKIFKKNLKNLKEEDLFFPSILKPTIGFLSFGVYVVKNYNEWLKIMETIDEDIRKIEDRFYKNVVDFDIFILEELIEGEEYALDAYYDKDGEPVIINIFKHPFFDNKDVSDRAYYTSKEVFIKNYDKFYELLKKLGDVCKFKNFPLHLELRKRNNEIIPIEANPLRFAGWCITDIAHYAWGINPYVYFMEQIKPNWDEILDSADDSYYYFTIGDIPKGAVVEEVDYDGYLENISNPLDIRKIDYKKNPIFAIVFAKTSSLDEIRDLLKLDMNKYLVLRK